MQDKIGEYEQKLATAEKFKIGLDKQLEEFDFEGKVKAYKERYESAQRDYNSARDEINQAYNKTGVQSELIADFLKITQSLTPEITKQSTDIATLSSLINMMHDTIEEYCSSEYKIKEFLTNKKKMYTMY